MKYGIALAVILGVAFAAYYSPWSSTFETQTSKAKLDWLYKQVLADNGKQGTQPGKLDMLSLVNPSTFLGGQDFNEVGHLVQDQYIANKHKGIHAVGVAGTAKFVWDTAAVSKYTGSFKQADHVFFRMSPAAMPSGGINTPSMSIKVLRNNAPSGNVMIMYDLHGQPEDNIFAHPMSNHINRPPNDDMAFGEKLLFKKFTSYDKHAGMIGLADIAGYDQMGRKVANPASPLALYFQPNPAVTAKCQGKPMDGAIYGCLQDLPVGTEMYRVYAADKPWTPKELAATKESPLKPIGWFVLTKQMKPSEFADEKVLFKHVFWADELKQQPGHPSSWNVSDDGEYAYNAGVKKFNKYAPAYKTQSKRRLAAKYLKKQRIGY